MPQLQNTKKQQTQPQSNTGMDIVKGLLQLVGQGATGTAKAVGSQVMDNSPIAIISQLLGTISALPEAQNLQKAGQGTQTQEQKPQFNPYQEGVIKALKKAGEAHVSEAVMSGVPPEHIVEQAGVMPQMDLGTINVAGSNKSSNSPPNIDSPLANPLINQQNQQQNFNIPKQGLLETNQNYAQTLLNIITKQKIVGEEPLQAGEEKKLGLEYNKAIAVEELKNAADMAKEGNLKPEHIFNKFESASQPFIIMRDSQGRIESAAKDPSGASDYALLFNFVKIQDPTSSVREGERADAINARGVPDAIASLYNKVLNGKTLSTKQRLDFLTTSRRLFKSGEMQQKKTTEQFKSLAARNGINFENIIRDTGLAQENGSTKTESPFKVTEIK